MNILRKIRLFIRWVVILFFGSTILSVVALKWLPVYITPLMVIRCVQQVKDGRHLRLKHHWVPLEEMSRQLPVAVMVTEDSHFLQHRGFDFKEISNAIGEHQAGKRDRGASTISQQTAKNVFLWPGGGWVRKGFEAYFTVLIEFVWGKRRIMEIYLNSIEMGDGIYGAEAVAQQHFGCKAMDLQRRHCALIAISLPNPLKMDSSAPGPYMLKRQTRVMADIAWAERTGGVGDLSVFDAPKEEGKTE